MTHPLHKLILGLLLTSVLASALAWRLQASAASDLARASEFQGRQVPDSDSEPPDVQAYREIVDILNESIEIRRHIDGLLGQVEGLVYALQQTQGGAENVSDLARRELVTIGVTLGGAVDAARDSLGKVGRLDGRLASSVRLARLIAAELKELDESLGPSAGKP